MFVRPLLITCVIIALNAGNTFALHSSIRRSIGNQNHPSPQPAPNVQHHQRREIKTQVLSPPSDGPKFSSATCGKITYDREDIIDAMEKGCQGLPVNYAATKAIKATVYQPTPSGTDKQSPKLNLAPIVSPTLYLVPIIRKKMKFPNIRHSIFNRLVLDEKCQAVDVIIEIPKKVLNPITWFNYALPKHQIGEYNQNDYEFQKCNLS